MALVTGTILEIVELGGSRTARISVGGAIARVRLDLLESAAIGDTVLAEAGVAIALVSPEHNKEKRHVSGDSR